MPYFRRATPPDNSRAPTRPPYAAPVGYHAVRLAAPDAAIVHPIEQFADESPATDAAIVHPIEQFADEFPETDAAIVHPIEQYANEFPVNTLGDWINLLHDEQVGVAAGAVRAILEDSVRVLPRSGTGGYFRYPSVEFLAAAPGPGVRLVDPKSMEEMTLALPAAAADAVQVLRRATIYRLSDIFAEPLILRAHPCALATESTETVIKLKIATVLVCLIWRGLNGQSWRLCQEVNEECFVLVVGQFVEKLLEVARSFTDTSWCACPVEEMLAIFDALFDVLYNIHRLPLKKSDEIAGISSNMVDSLSAVLEGTISDIDSSAESTIHPVTVVLIQFLEFFHDHRDMVQSMVAAGYPCSVLLKSWIARLGKDTEKISQGEKGARYIFLLNNSYDFSQVMRHPGASFFDQALASKLISVIEGYRKSYFDECWVPLIMPLHEEHYLKKPNPSSLDEFTRHFVSLCRCHMLLKVRPGLKYELREEIKNVVFPPYRAFLNALQANPNRPSEVVCYFKRVMERKKNQNGFTVEQLEQVIEQLYES